MNTEEKLEKLNKLADAMYYAAQYLTTDASRLHKAMDEYHQFIINKYHKEEQTIPDIVDEHFDEMLGEESIPLNVQEAAHQYIFNTPSLILPLLHDTDLRWEKVVIEELERAFTAGIKWKESQISKDASKLT